MAGDTRPCRFAFVGGIALVLSAACLFAACDLTGDADGSNEETSEAPDESPSPRGESAPRDDCGLPAESGSRDVEVGAGAAARTFRLHVPAGYDPDRPYPVVLNFHGAGGTAVGQEELSGFAAASDDAGFIAAMPQADPAVRTWRLGVDFAIDLSFVVEVMDEVQRQLCIDPDRVYATGFSDGATFANALACAGFRLAGFAVVSGGGSRNCRPFQAMPVVGFHGTADDILPYESIDPERWAAGWAEINECDEPREIQATDGVAIAYQACTQPVVFYRLEGAGHQWPGGRPIEGLGPTPDLDATSVLLEFFGITG